MTGYELLPHAKAAIADIYDYTFDQWGPNQAERYIDGLIEIFEAVAHRKILWRAIPAEFEVAGHWCRYEQHYVYWRTFDDGGVGIVCILHTSMMQGERLKEAFGADSAEG